MAFGPTEASVSFEYLRFVLNELFEVERIRCFGFPAGEVRENKLRNDNRQLKVYAIAGKLM